MDAPTPPRMKNIVIVNDGLGPNKGDQAILYSMLKDLREALPEASITAFPNSKMLRLDQYARFCQALKKSDVFIFGGGQEIQDQASVVFLISGMLKIILAKFFAVPVYGCALGAGPLRTALGKLLTRLVLNRVDLITVRDVESRRILKKLGVINPPCIVTADPSLSLPPLDGHNNTQAHSILTTEGIPQNSGPRVAIAPRRWFHYRHYFLPMSIRSRIFPPQGQKEHRYLLSALARTADHFAERSGAQIFFVPMRSSEGRFDPGQDDERTSRDIRNLMVHKKNAFLITRDYSPQAIKAFLGKMDLVIGMRMHALMFASMMTVPVVGIALSPKFEGFFRMIGQSDYLLLPNALNTAAILEKSASALAHSDTIKKELRSKKPVLQNLARSNAGYVKNVLQKENE